MRQEPVRIMGTVARNWHSERTEGRIFDENSEVLFDKDLRADGSSWRFRSRFNTVQEQSVAQAPVS
jgi:hypothetical protein